MAANLLFDRMANGDLEQNLGGGGNSGSHQHDEDDDNLFNWYLQKVIYNNISRIKSK